MLQDITADMFTRIRNAAAAKHGRCVVPCNGVNLGILKVIKDSGYIKDFQRIDFKTIKVTLKYFYGENVIRSIDRISKPSLRIYKKAKAIKPYMRGLGMYIVSTNRGIISDTKARTLNLGGEIIGSLT